MTDRARQLEFISSFGRNKLRDLLTEALDVDGLNFLTDDQIATLAHMQALKARRDHTRMVRNRNIIAMHGERKGRAA